jgi:hypothetical protein
MEVKCSLFFYPRPSISALPFVWPVFHSCPLLFRWLFVGQWDFWLCIISVHALCLSQCNPLNICTSSPFPLICVVFSMFPCVLFLHRCDVFHYYSPSFFPSFPHPLVFFTTPTFWYMLCINFYICIILLVFVLGLYFIYERKHVAFGFLSLANFP